MDYGLQDGRDQGLSERWLTAFPKLQRAQAVASKIHRESLKLMWRLLSSFGRLAVEVRDDSCRPASVVPHQLDLWGL